MAELLPYGLWTRVGGKNIQSYLPGGTNVPSWSAHLANTIVPSVCCGDAAALCQITLTTCYCYYYFMPSCINFKELEAC